MKQKSGEFLTKKVCENVLTVPPYPIYSKNSPSSRNPFPLPSSSSRNKRKRIHGAWILLGPLLVFQRTNSRFRCKNIPGLAASECFFLYSRPSRVLSYSSGWHSRVADYRSGFDSETSRREKLSPSSARRRGNAHSAGCTRSFLTPSGLLSRVETTRSRCSAIMRSHLSLSLSLSLVEFKRTDRGACKDKRECLPRSCNRH